MDSSSPWQTFVAAVFGVGDRQDAACRFVRSSLIDNIVEKAGLADFVAGL